MAIALKARSDGFSFGDEVLVGRAQEDAHDLSQPREADESSWTPRTLSRTRRRLRTSPGWTRRSTRLRAPPRGCRLKAEKQAQESRRFSWRGNRAVAQLGGCLIGCDIEEL